MENVNFIIVGQYNSSLLLIHKDDYNTLFTKEDGSAIINGYRVALEEGKCFAAELVTQWMKFFAFEEVEEATQNMIEKIIERKLSDEEIVKMIEIIELHKSQSDGKE